MNIKDLVQAYPALQEFGIAANIIKPTMVDPTVSRNVKRRTLSAITDTLTEKTFQNSIVAGKIMEIINMKEEVCKEYPDSESQVEGILSWLPRFRKYKGMLLESVKNNRKQCGLKL